MMNRQTLEELCELLMPHLSDTNERRALVEAALFDCSVLSQIDWTGNAYTFCVRLVRTLDTYGECTRGTPAIVSLLNMLKKQVGTDKQKSIDDLITRLSGSDHTKGDRDMTPEAAGFMFLLEVGRWAKNELQERWTLRRKEREIDLATIEKEELETASPQLVEELVIDLGETRVNRTVERLKAKYDLIEGWKDALVADQKQNQLGDMSLAVLEAKERDYNEKISKTLRGIESDLQDLGFTIDKG